MAGGLAARREDVEKRRWEVMLVRRERGRAMGTEA
jgi:hypothetical protein